MRRGEMRLRTGTADKCARRCAKSSSPASPSVRWPVVLFRGRPPKEKLGRAHLQCPVPPCHGTLQCPVTPKTGPCTQTGNHGLGAGCGGLGAGCAGGLGVGCAGAGGTALCGAPGASCLGLLSALLAWALIAGRAWRRRALARRRRAGARGARAVAGIHSRRPWHAPTRGAPPPAVGGVRIRRDRGHHGGRLRPQTYVCNV